MKIAFIGAGVMGEAMISGLLGAGSVGPEDIRACDIDPGRWETLEESYGIKCELTGPAAIVGCDVVVLSVKPQSLHDVFLELHGRLQPEQLVLSIVAGASAVTIGRGLGHEAVIRVMPNTPARIGAGISVWTATEAVTEEQKQAARVILAALGKEVFVADEKYIDMATAVSASGPAYIFVVMESLIDAAVHIGLPRQTASELVLETVLGSVLLAQKTGEHPAALRSMVTSPGGTTAEGLLRLEEGGMRGVLASAVIAAYEKALLLAAEGGP